MSFERELRMSIHGSESLNEQSGNMMHITCPTNTISRSETNAFVIS
jgi:hypothetical protein